jgi:transketolase
VFAKDDPDWKHTVECGAYIVRKGADKPDLTILATGSEVSLALEAVALVSDKRIRVVSVLSKELFEAQSAIIRETIVGGKAKDLRIVTVEAGVRTGWEGWTSEAGDNFSINRFGESGPGSKIAAHLGFTAEKLAALLRA